jgi:two-component system response regulator RegA
MVLLPTRWSALVVEPDSEDRRLVVSTLSECNFRVTVTERFSDAKTLLWTQPPDALITNLRLGEYNGLHLVLRGKTARPSLVALVLSDVRDAVLQADAAQFGATFILKPLNAKELRAALLRSLFRRGDDDPPIHPPFERRVADRRAGVGAAGLGSNRRVGERRRTLVAETPPHAVVL